MNRPLMILDRDGVLNLLRIDPEHGTIDSPLHPSQVEIFPWVPEALKIITDLEFETVIATNQPAAAKGKTTLANLEAVHSKIVSLAQSGGGKILNSYICFHRTEDQCECRKPKTGLLKRAFKEFPDASVSNSWMVGDSVTDVQAGHKLGLKTAFLGPTECDYCNLFDSKALNPQFIGTNLLEFANFIRNGSTNR